MNASQPWHKRLPDFETFDRIEVYIVPRYKTSGLSGDEWRQHVQVDFFFKGIKVHEFGCRDMNAMAMLLGARMIESYDNGISQKSIDAEVAGICDQPSCKELSVSKLKIKKEFNRGEALVTDPNLPGNFRQFCAKHLRRGDCDREDCDDNYEVMSGPGPDASTNTETSPSRQVKIQVDSMEDLPAAIAEARKKATK